jgi:hypothetical protein
MSIRNQWETLNEKGWQQRVFGCGPTHNPNLKLDGKSYSADSVLAIDDVLK